MTLSGSNLLVVEDEFLIAFDIQCVLESFGARVHTVATVADGLRAADEDYDAAVLDVRLPDGEVFPVAEKLTAHGVPLVFHSGHAREDALTARFPMARVLTKPAREQLLVATIGEQIRREASRQGA